MKVNGEKIDFIKGENILALLEREGYDAKRVIVEKNGDILTKDSYSAIFTEDEDTIEVISFVGGG